MVLACRILRKRVKPHAGQNPVAAAPCGSRQTGATCFRYSLWSPAEHPACPRPTNSTPPSPRQLQQAPAELDEVFDRGEYELGHSIESHVEQVLQRHSGRRAIHVNVGGPTVGHIAGLHRQCVQHSPPPQRAALQLGLVGLEDIHRRHQRTLVTRIGDVDRLPDRGLGQGHRPDRHLHRHAADR